MIGWLRDKYDEIAVGLANCWHYLPIIWRTREFDYAYLLMLMEAKFRRMAVAIGDNGCHVRADRSGRQLRVCAELCRRIREDQYLENLNSHDNWGAIRIGRNGVRAYSVSLHEMAERNRKNDVSYLCRMMDKHLHSWWD